MGHSRERNALTSTAVVRRRPVVDGGDPLVTLLALPPDAHGGALRHLGRKKVAISLVIPLLGDFGILRLKIARLQHHAAAERTKRY